MSASYTPVKPGPNMGRRTNAGQAVSHGERSVSTAEQSTVNEGRHTSTRQFEDVKRQFEDAGPAVSETDVAETDNAAVEERFPQLADLDEMDYGQRIEVFQNVLDSLQSELDEDRE